MRPLSLVLLASLVGVPTLAVLLGPVSQRGLAVRPAEAAARVNVTARCDGNPEKVVVTNNTRHRVKVRRATSIYQPRSNEPFRVDRTLRRGRSITFESGPAANHNVLTRQYVFNSDVGTKEGAREGARVATSVGRFADRCARQTRAEPVSGTPSQEARLSPERAREMAARAGTRRPARVPTWGEG